MYTLPAASIMPQSRRHKYTYPKISEEDEKFVVRSPYPDVEIPECNMADFVWKNVEQWPEHVALVRDLVSAFEKLTFSIWIKYVTIFIILHF